MRFKLPWSRGEQKNYELRQLAAAKGQRLLVPDGIRKSTRAKDEWTNLEGVGSYEVR